MESTDSISRQMYLDDLEGETLVQITTCGGLLPSSTTAPTKKRMVRNMVIFSI